MVRIARLNTPGVIYHLIARFIERRWFIETDEARESYLRLLGRAVSESDWRCFTYTVMSNHIHLGVLAGEEPLGRWIRRAHSPFADLINKKFDRIGPVFVRGPKDYAIPLEKAGTLIAYIHNNPVRAGVVDNARDSTWTSHRAYLGLERAPRWLDVELGLSFFGQHRASLVTAVADTTIIRRHISLRELRTRARRRGTIELATPTLSEPVEVPLVTRADGHIRPSSAAVLQVVAEVLQLPLAEICSRRNDSRLVQARRIAAHCARVKGLSGAEIAAALGISAQAVSKHQARALASNELGIATDVSDILESATGFPA